NPCGRGLAGDCGQALARHLKRQWLSGLVFRPRLTATCQAAASDCEGGCTSNSVISNRSSTLKLSPSPWTTTVRPDCERDTKSGCLTKKTRPSPIRIVKGRKGCEWSTFLN